MCAAPPCGTLYSITHTAPSQGNDDASIEGADAAPAEDECPGEFAHREDEKAFTVHPAEGVNLILQSGIGGGSRDAGAVAAHISLTPGGVSSVLVVTDQRGPTAQAVVQPGQDGRVIKLSTTLKPAPRASVELEAVLASPGVQSVKGTLKYAGPDFHAIASLQAPLGGGGAPHGELTYHQTLAPGWTGGGQLQALLAPPMVPIPTVGRLFWGTYGSWINTRRDSAVYARYGQQPRPDGGANEQLQLHAWRRATRSLELGADVSLTTSALVEPVDSAAGVGARVTFEGGNQAPPSTLTVHLSTNLVAGVSLQQSYVGLGSGTFMRSTLTSVNDHRAKDYKVGATVELYS